ncbi:MAG: CPBP family intramembrane glutamic endopeptidase [Chloroflexota bacterium]
MKNLLNWKVFLILWLAAILAALAVLPYAFELQEELIAQVPISLPVLIALQIAQSGILFGILIFIGMILMKRIGLSAPILDSVARGESASDKIRAVLPISIALGVIAALLIIGLDMFIFQPALLRELGESADGLNLQTSQPAAWKGFLASFYGGIAEEIQLRLFIMSLLAWLGSLINKTPEGKPTSAVFWIAIIATAILFGLGHLPATATIIPLTPLVITRAILLNGLGGAAFGYLYWKRGLESAMIAHFSTDIVLHVLLAL